MKLYGVMISVNELKDGLRSGATDKIYQDAKKLKTVGFQFDGFTEYKDAVIIGYRNYMTAKNYKDLVNKYGFKSARLVELR